MKRIMMSAAVLALLATGCQNEVLVEQSQPQEGQLFTLEVGRGFESRTVLGTPNAEGTPTWWSEDDAIYVSGADGKVSGVLKFVKFIDDDKTKAEFSGYVTGGQPTELEHIVFPVPEGGKTINMADRTPGKLDAPMIGTINGGAVVTLKNVGGIIAFNSDKAYDVRAMNGNANMAAGTYTFDPTTGKLDYEPGTLNDVTPTYKSTVNPELVYVPVATTTDPTDGTNNTELTGVTIDALQNGAVISSATVTVTSSKIVGDEEGELTLPAISAWDGQAQSKSWYDDHKDESTFTISEASELAYLATLVNRTENPVYFKNKTIKLGANIDLNNKTWIPIGNVKSGKDKGFLGTFDGDGFTINNLNIEGEGYLGLFGSINFNGTKIMNLTLNNVIIKGTNYVGTFVGHSLGAKIINCHVNVCNIKLTPKLVDGQYDLGDKAGGIVGFADGNEQISGQEARGNTLIRNCSVSNLKITAYRDFGGLVGFADSATLESNIIESVELIVDNSKNYKQYTANKDYCVGTYVGRTSKNFKDNNTNTGNADIVYPY